MKIPKYIQNLLERATFNLTSFETCTPGYTIEISKRTPYQTVDTFRQEIQKLVDWANKQVRGDAEIVRFPDTTHYVRQYALVNIYDPLMMRLEKYIGEKRQ